MNASPVRIQDLLMPKMLEAYTEERWQHIEPVIAASLHPFAEKVQRSANIDHALTALLRTAVLFVVDHDEVQEVIDGSYLAPTMELPPLPFSRVAFETGDDSGWKVWTFEEHEIRSPEDLRTKAYGRAESGEHEDYVLDLILIDEVEQGQEWFVIFVCRVPAEEPLLWERHVQCFTYSSDGTVRLATMNNEEGFVEFANNGMPSLFRVMPVELAHLVTARGVSLVQTGGRADRRRAQRAGFTFPTIYWVDLRSSAEVTRGQSDRTYHCRWLVRGHWRHLDDERRTWIKPYIKGPAGAPWKGRPVYRAVAPA